MKIKFLVSIFAMGAAISVYAKNIDFCKTIEFDTGEFNYQVIEKASSNSECRDKPVPIQYKGINDTFNLTSEASPTGGASYLTWDESRKAYGYDKNELKSTIHDIVSQSKENKYIEALNPVVKIKFIPKGNGGVVVSDIVFEDKDSKPISVVRDIYFYSQDNYAAVYGSSPIKCSQEDRILFIEKVELLFESMNVNW
ncbi:hypothetical protein FEM41_11385 [Jejubacter calystegiae]|uniref:Uncharacterized protein n=1 Tax=Jejubacter calystegiae TaxID=2579935 RepID=A0A4P8YHY2_9ENTR|nr:hypothetical protein [Jejubacter calystegiae]QCT20210.1 hypothetical protein FEM41_11385 [Jejubacter calystegiae]